MGGACSTYEVEDRCMKGFGGNTCGEKTNGNPRHTKEDNIKMDLQAVGMGPWTEFIWIRIGTGGGLS